MNTHNHLKETAPGANIRYDPANSATGNHGEAITILGTILIKYINMKINF